MGLYKRYEDWMNIGDLKGSRSICKEYERLHLPQLQVYSHAVTMELYNKSAMAAILNIQITNKITKIG